MTPPIVISAGRLAPGGVETHVRILSLVLQRAGYTVIICGTACNWMPESVRQLGVAGVRFAVPPSLISAIPRLGAIYSLLRWRLNPPRGALSLYAVGAGRTHAWLKRRLGPGVFSIYHEVVSPPGPQSPAAECLRLMDGAIANSGRVARRMETICPRKPLRVIPFLTAEAARPIPVLRWVPVAGPLRVGYLGRLERRKRPHVLVKEWARITSQPPLSFAVLHVYGGDEGGLLEELEAYVRTNALGSRIQLHGHYEHEALPEVLSELDFVVLPSEWEGLPLVLVEAMQHGVPFVATDAGGTAELAEGNPDVIVTGTEWRSFEDGLRRMAVKLRAVEINPTRLHDWAEERYGFETVSPLWKQALAKSTLFFGEPHQL